MTPAEVNFDTGSKSWKREFQVVLATGHQHTNSRRCHLWAVNQRSPSYRLRLRQWHADALTELRAAFHARAGLLRPQLEKQANATETEYDSARLAADLELLRGWTASV